MKTAKDNKVVNKPGSKQKRIDLKNRAIAEIKKMDIDCQIGGDVIHAGKFIIRCIDIPCGVNFPGLLSQLPDRGSVNCILHRRSTDELVAMSKRDFYRIMQALDRNDIKIKNQLI